MDVTQASSRRTNVEEIIERVAALDVDKAAFVALARPGVASVQVTRADRVGRYSR